jgi:paraquat-inducible protein A
MTGRHSALELGLARCHACELVSSLDTDDVHASCPRCGTVLHSRKPESLARTWAYLLAAYVLYIPANVLPIMRTRTLFGVQDDTILSGILYLWHGGSGGLAVIVFCASILVPLVKLFALTALALSVRLKARRWLEPRTRLYRAVDFVGRWSMLDVYVLGLLTALVQTPAVAEIRPGPAAIAFASVVVLTLLASRSFDIRLVWDAAQAHVPVSERASGPILTARIPETDR